MAKPVVLGKRLATLAPRAAPMVVAWQDRRRGSRHQRGYGTDWDKLRIQILERDQYLCQCEDCKALDRVREARHVDHIVNKAEGGDDHPSNLRAINKDCHKLKTQREATRGRVGHRGGI